MLAKLYKGFIIKLTIIITVFEMNFTAIGMMTGTSMDGIDAVIVQTDGQSITRTIANASLQYTPAFRNLLKIAAYAMSKEKGDYASCEKQFDVHAMRYIRDIGLDPQKLKTELSIKSSNPFSLKGIVKHLTNLHIELIYKLIEDAELKIEEIDLIGAHGQTLLHDPENRITIQVIDGQLIADTTGLFVIDNFRNNDIKHGGQGAPIAPIYHQLLAKTHGLEKVAVINCGGIANVTIVDADNIIGFDTGPGNILIDNYVRLKTFNQECMDEDGKYASLGTVQHDLLELLKQNAFCNQKQEFIKEALPKSLDISDLTLIPELNDISINDGCATLAAFTAEMIIKSLEQIEIHPKTWVISGGGSQNKGICNFLQIELQKHIKGATLVKSSDIGWSNQHLEAELIAYVAVRALKGLAITFPKTTGVLQPVTGGQGYLPKLEQVFLSSKLKSAIEQNQEILTGYGANLRLNKEQSLFIAKALNLGEVTSLPIQLHKTEQYILWLLQTSKGIYMIKHFLAHSLNIAKLEMAESIAHQFNKLGIKTVAAIKCKGQYTLQTDFGIFISYEWDKTIQINKTIKSRHTKIAVLLSQLHILNLQVLGSSTYQPKQISDDGIKQMCLQAKSLDLEFAEALSLNHDKMLASNEQYKMYLPLLSSNLVLSHTSIKDLAWDQHNNPIIMDWYDCAKINPAYNIIKHAIIFSYNNSCNKFNTSMFWQIIGAYYNAGNDIEAKALRPAFLAIIIDEIASLIEGVASLNMQDKEATLYKKTHNTLANKLEMLLAIYNIMEELIQICIEKNAA